MMRIRSRCLCVAALLVAGCSTADTPDRAGVKTPRFTEADWTTKRVGGDLFAMVERPAASDDKAVRYRFGRSFISTPLPVGYPDPTPPGAIELKKYPVVRRAEFSGTMNADMGMNAAFIPLFRHIEKHSIAMTSPVEMNYAGLTQSERADSWTMSFLYRSPDMNTTGKDGTVTVSDQPPVTVISIGMKGNYSTSLAQRGISELEAWLKANPEWERAGEPRALYYNGPEVKSGDKWSETQIPVRPAKAK